MVFIVGGARPPEYVSIPSALVARIRKVSAFLGFGTIVLSICVGIVGLPWAFVLPTAEDPLTFVLVALVAAQVLFGLISGIAATSGRSCVATGELNRTAGSGVYRFNLVYMIGTLLCTVFSWGLMALLVSASDSGFTAEVMAYLVLITVPAILTIVSVAGASRLLRPSASVLRKYGD